MQGDPDQFLAITFVDAATAGGRELVDCAAYGNEVSWKPTKGTTYLIMEAGFEAIEVGRLYALSDMDSTKIYFDRGHLRTTFQVDAKGDVDLSNDEYSESSRAILADNGPHPISHFDGDWCADIVVPLLGD